MLFYDGPYTPLGTLSVVLVRSVNLVRHLITVAKVHYLCVGWQVVLIKQQSMRMANYSQMSNWIIFGIYPLEIRSKFALPRGYCGRKPVKWSV